MPLPHPHGNASGEIAHNSIYDTGVTPGSTGGKFIGFGEEGTTANANRTHWALSENVDYVYNILAGDLAVPAGASWVVPGGGASTFQFTGDVWVGDPGYPVIEAEGLLVLFSVLDDQYNELDDGSGNEVRVAVVRDTTNVINAYKNDFETDAVITFKTVNPITGADVVNPYTIPAATDVRILYAEKGNIESLPTDAFIKFKVHSGAEVEAGVLLQEGSRPLTANWDIGEHDITNIAYLMGPSGGNDFLIYSNAGASRIGFQDSTSSGDIWLSQSEAAAIESPSGLYDSLVGGINMTALVVQGLVGNRCLTRSGGVVFTGATGDIAWPAIETSIDGERIRVAPGNVTATTDAVNTRCLVVNSVGAVVEKLATALLSSDIPLTAHRYNGAAFFQSSDIRWAYQGTTRTLEITCGSGGGTDFSGTELQEALELAAVLKAAGQPAIIRIKGRALASAETNVLGDVAIIGDTTGTSELYATMAAGVHFLNCHLMKVRMENLTFIHEGPLQNAGIGAIRNAGSGSIFRNLVFEKDAGGTNIGWGSAFTWGSMADTVTIENVEAKYLTEYFILGSTADYISATYLWRSVIQNCRMTNWGATAKTGIILTADGNIVRNVYMGNGLADYNVVGGNDILIDKCTFWLVGAGGAAPSCVFWSPATGSNNDPGMIIRDTQFNSAAAGVTAAALNDASLYGRVQVLGCRFHVVDKSFNFNAVVLVHGSTSLLVDGCQFSNTNEYILSVDNILHVKFINSFCNILGGDGIIVGVDAGAVIDNNWFEGYGSAGGSKRVIDILVGGPRCEVTNNIIGSVGAPLNSEQVASGRKFIFTDNQLLGAGAPAGVTGLLLYWFIVGADNCTVAGNHFDSHTGHAISIGGGANGVRVEDNAITNVSSDVAGIWVNGATNTLIIGNHFNGADYVGLGILVEDGGVGTNAEATQILNNQFRDVQGLDTFHSYYGVVFIFQSGGGSRNCMVSGNEFHACGYDGAVLNGSWWQTINCQGEAAQIQNNHIKQMSGYHTNSTTVGIYMTNEGTVSGNTIFHDLTPIGQPAAIMHGIYINIGAIFGPVICSHNFIDFRGSNAAGAGKNIRGISLNASNDVSVMGNVINDFDLIGSNQLAMEATGNRNIYVGNISNTRSVSLAVAKPVGAGLRADFNTGAGF